MGFVLNSQIASALAELAPAGDGVLPPAGDVQTRRTMFEASLARRSALQPMPTDVTMTDYWANADDGAAILLRWYAKEGAAPGSAVLYIHGGGMILGSVALFDGPVSRYVSDSGVPMLSAEYRYAPEYPFPTPTEDCYASLRWLAQHTSDLGVDPARIALMGHSGGGGLAAATALLARDRGGPALARQILIYPMLDDRNTTPDPELVPFISWNYDDNITGWSAVLGEAIGGPDVSPYAAPARMTDPAGLPPTYLEVGELDIFHDEVIECARRLTAAGVSTELHVHPGVPHAFESLAPYSDVALRSRADRIRTLTSF